MPDSPRCAADPLPAATELRLLRTLERIAGIGAWQIDTGSWEMLWTDEVYRILDVAPSGAAPSLEFVLSFLEPGQRDQLRAAIDRALVSGEGWDLELAARTAEPRELRLRLTGEVQRPVGSNVLLCGTLEDVTAQSKQREALKARSFEARKLAAVAESSSSLIMLTDVDQRIQWVNASFARGTGYTLLEAIGQRPSGLLQAPDLSAPPELLTGGGRSSRLHELRLQRKDGTPFWAVVEVRTVRNAEGEITHLVFRQDDVTENRQTERQAAEAANWLGIARVAAGIGFFYQPDQPPGAAMVVDEQARGILGLQPDESGPSAQDLLAMVVPQDRERFLAAREHSGADPVEVEYRIRRRGDEAPRWLRALRIRLPATEHEPGRIAGALIDITDLRSVDRQRRLLAERLELVSAVHRIGVWDIDASSGAVQWNESMLELYAAEPDDVPRLLGQWLERYVFAKDHARLTENLRYDAPHAGVSPQRRIEHRIVRGDGELRWIESQSTCLVTDDGRVMILGTSSDITERKHSERRLRDALERLELATERAGVGVFTRDSVAGNGYWSPQVFQLFGMPVEAQAPPVERIVQRLHPDDRASYQKMRTGSLAEAEIEELRVRVLLPEGRLRWLLIRGRPEQSSGGAVSHVAGVVLDITAQEEAKARAAANAAWLQLSTEASGIGTWERDLATGVGRWDATMYALHGLPAQGGAPSAEYQMHSYHVADHQRVQQAWQRMAESDEVVEFEHRTVRLDGAIRHFLSRGRRERGSDGAPTRIYGTTLDVTDSRETSNQLAITLRRLQLATEASGIGTWQRDVATGEAVWDATMRQIMGLSADEPVPSREDVSRRLVHPDDRAQAAASWQRMIDAPHAIEAEFRIARADGSIAYVNSRGLVERDDRGRPLRAIGTAIDITASRTAQRQLREFSEWMQLANGATGVAYFRLGLDDKTQYTDGQMKKLYGFDPDGPDPTQDQFFAAILPEDLDRVIRVRALSRQSDQSLEAEYRVRGPDGVLRQILTRRALLRNEAGEPLYVVGTAIDVTASRSAQAALQIANQRLGLAQRTAGIGIWEWDVERGQMRIDETIRALLGVDRHWIPDFERWMALVHPDDRARARAVYEIALPTDVSEGRSEYRVVRADGRVRHVDERYAIHRDTSGRALRLLGTNLDITDIREAEQQRAALVNRLQLATQTAGIGVWERNIGTGTEEWDAQMHAIYGTAAGSVGTRSLWLAHVHPDDRASLQAQLRSYDDTGVNALEYRIVRTDGEIRHIADRSRIERDADGRVVRRLGVHLDITDIRRAERERDELARRMQMVASSIGMGLWEWLPPTGQIVWSELMFALYGCAKPQDTREWLEAVHPEDRNSLYRSLLAALKGGESAQLEFRVQWQDGSVHWLSNRASIRRDAAGRAIQLTGVTWDITDRKLTEAALLGKEAAERASQAKTEFLSRMSHELRTPLNAILGFAQILEIDAAQPLSAMQRDRVEHIKRAGWHLLELINEILDLSRIEAGAATLSLAAVAAREVAEECLVLVRADCERRRLAVELFEAPGLPCLLWADRTRLKQVLLNLLSNAVKYNAEGGRVTVCIGSDDSGVGRVSVRDTGPGLSPAQRERLFEPFNRLGLESAPIEGTGIGLTIAKSLAEQMGGAIAVQSEPGRGSEFSVTLPLASTASSATAAPTEIVHSTRERADVCGSVLYVEDNPANYAVVEAVLRQRPGVTLMKAADGSAARVLAAVCQPDLILVDMRLPDTDGLSLFRALRAEPATQAIPCIGLSANALPGDIDAARAAGFADYLTKPLTAAELLRCVDRALATTA
jgi:PAS domain S-box-containing protein